MFVHYHTPTCQFAYDVTSVFKLCEIVTEKLLHNTIIQGEEVLLQEPMVVACNYYMVVTDVNGVGLKFAWSICFFEKLDLVVVYSNYNCST